MTPCVWSPRRKREALLDLLLNEVARDRAKPIEYSIGRAQIDRRPRAPRALDIAHREVRDRSLVRVEHEPRLERANGERP